MNLASPQRVFRHLLRQALGLSFLLVVVYQLLAVGLAALLDKTSLERLDWLDWGHQLMTSGLLIMLLASFFPWLVSVVYAEWLFTRGFEQQQLKRLWLREYLWWWGGLALALGAYLLGLTRWSYSSVPLLPWELFGFWLSFSLMLAMLIVNQAHINRWQWGVGGAFLLWLLIGDNWQLGAAPQTLAVGHLISWGLWLTLLAITAYRAWRPQDIHLTQFGQLQAEDQAMSAMPWYRAIKGTGLQPLEHFQSSGQRLFAGFQLLGRLSYMQYAQLLLLWLVMAGVAVYQASWQARVLHSELVLQWQLLIGGLVLLALLVAVQPGWVLRRRLEFYFSLPVSRLQLYLTNWLMQAVALLAGWLVIALASWLLPEAHFQPLQLLPVFGFFWLGGWLGLGLVLVLIGMGLGLSLGWLVAAQVVFVSHSPWAWLLWVGVLAYRLLNLWGFCRQELVAGPWQQRLGQGLLQYGLAGLLLAGGLIGGSTQLPLARYFSLNTAASEMYMSLLVWHDLVREQFYAGQPEQQTRLNSWAPKPEELLLTQQRRQAVRQLVHSPQDRGARLQLADAFLKEQFDYQLRNPERQYWLQRHFEAQHLREAELSELFESTLLRGLEPEAQLGVRSQLKWLKQDYAESLKLAKQAFASLPTAQNGVWLAQLLQHGFRYQDAIGVYQQLLQKAPEQSRRWFHQLAALKLLQNQWSEAFAAAQAELQAPQSQASPEQPLAFASLLASADCQQVSDFREQALPVAIAERLEQRLAGCQVTGTSPLPFLSVQEWQWLQTQRRVSYIEETEPKAWQAWLKGDQQSAAYLLGLWERSHKYWLLTDYHLSYLHQLPGAQARRAWGPELRFRMQPSVATARAWLFASPDLSRSWQVMAQQLKPEQLSALQPEKQAWENLLGVYADQAPALALQGSWRLSRVLSELTLQTSPAGSQEHRDALKVQQALKAVLSSLP